MNFITYINNRLQGIAAEASKGKSSTVSGAEADAIMAIFTGYRFLMGTLFIPIIFLKFVLTTLHIMRRPMAELDMLRAQEAARKHASKAKSGKKLGFATAVKLPKNIPEDF